jgi:hypothetical protein
MLLVAVKWVRPSTDEVAVGSRNRMPCDPSLRELRRVEAREDTSRGEEEYVTALVSKDAAEVRVEEEACEVCRRRGEERAERGRRRGRRRERARDILRGDCCWWKGVRREEGGDWGTVGQWTGRVVKTMTMGE